MVPNTTTFERIGSFGVEGAKVLSNCLRKGCSEVLS